MKRLNPSTGKPFVRGDTRPDGFLFLGYKLSRKYSNGYFIEEWASPERFNKTINYQQDWYIRNKDKVLTQSAAWHKANPEKRKIIAQKHRRNNLAKDCAKVMRRAASKIQRTPAWLNADQIKEIDAFYIEAQRLSKLTGILHHVDHIVPLRGRQVSGLHVPWNLQVIPAKDNLSKSNTFIDLSC